MSPVADPTKELRLLFAFFGDAELPLATIIPADDVPPPYHDLLVHHGHMTEALERYYASPVAVHPYRVHQHGEMYGRKLDLSLFSSGKIVMTGLMIINLTFVREEIARQIVAGTTPLGRILVDNNVLREVSSGAYLRLDPADPIVARFRQEKARPAYGRLATIFFDGKPAVDLLEIVAP
jgi:chorismate-pyruvate lyase